MKPQVRKNSLQGCLKGARAEQGERIVVEGGTE